MRMKYDCSNTLDFGHEYQRMCHSMTNCFECPLEASCSFYPTQKIIDIVQRWSNENPEPLKLTKREKEFLESFVFRDKKIVKDYGDTFIYKETGEGFAIDNCLFPFLEPDKQATFAELLALEVED